MTAMHLIIGVVILAWCTALLAMLEPRRYMIADT